MPRYLIFPAIWICLFCNVAFAQITFPPGFRPASAMPDEFFTCTNRAPGLYADDKRSCALYWNCSSNGTLDHIKCPSSAPVFDDKVGSCVKGEPEKCPVDYGYFQSAPSFCRGRPYSPKKEISREPSAQAYYPNRLNNCDSYFWCFVTDGQSQGFEFKCPSGQKFDEKSSVCKPADSALCALSHGADIV